MTDQQTTNTAGLPAGARILLTGASGYVGGRLLQLLEQQGYRVRCLARRPAVVQQKAGPGTEVVAGDVLDRASLDAALQACKLRSIWCTRWDQAAHLKQPTGKPR